MEQEHPIGKEDNLFKIGVRKIEEPHAEKWKWTPILHNSEN